MHFLDPYSSSPRHAGFRLKTPGSPPSRTNGPLPNPSVVVAVYRPFSPPVIRQIGFFSRRLVRFFFLPPSLCEHELLFLHVRYRELVLQPICPTKTFSPPPPTNPAVATWSECLPMILLIPDRCLFYVGGSRAFFRQNSLIRSRRALGIDRGVFSE